MRHEAIAKLRSALKLFAKILDEETDPTTINEVRLVVGQVETIVRTLEDEMAAEAE